MTTETTVAVVLTAEQKIVAKMNKLAERINADTGNYNELKGELEALQAVANIVAGNRVNATVGRGEKAVQIEGGLVLGVAETENGKQIKVSTGEGFDLQVYVLTPAQVTGVVAEVAEPVAEEAQAAE